MEVFSVPLALVDAIPVVLFGASMIMVALRFNNFLFILGAALSTLAGCMKVLWKLILGWKKKDVRWLDKPFVPMQITGFGLMLGAFLVSIRRIHWAGVWKAVSSLPSAALFPLWFIVMGAMGWYKKKKFEKYSDKTNWVAEILNIIGQGALFLAILFAKK